MQSTQVIEAIKLVMASKGFRPENELYSASAAREIVFATLRVTNPCAVCGGTGRDESKPFNPLTIVTDGQRCDACDGNGFQIEDSDQSVFDFVVATDNAAVTAEYGSPA